MWKWDRRKKTRTKLQLRGIECIVTASWCSLPFKHSFHLKKEITTCTSCLAWPVFGVNRETVTSVKKNKLTETSCFFTLKAEILYIAFHHKEIKRSEAVFFAHIDMRSCRRTWSVLQHELQPAGRPRFLGSLQQRKRKRSAIDWDSSLFGVSKKWNAPRHCRHPLCQLTVLRSLWGGARGAVLEQRRWESREGQSVVVRSPVWEQGEFALRRPLVV